MDVIFARIPAVVILREMQDEEQQVHLQKLKEAAGGALTTVSETKITAKELEKLLLTNLQSDRLVPACLNTNGAASAAQYIRSLLS
jgi:predicted glycosyltransferase